MILKELIQERRDVWTLTEDARIYEAAELMREKQVDSIVIVEDGLVAGIITDRDIALSLALGTATPQSYIAEAMSKDVETVHESMTILDVTRYFRLTQVRQLPVVDRKGKLLGMVSADDVISLLAREMSDTCNAVQDNMGQIA